MSEKKPLFAFFGTPLFGVRVLDALESHGLFPALIITAPDKPQGRGLTLTPTPTRTWAQERGIDVLTPMTLKDEVVIAELSNTDWDLFVVAAYAKLIPKNILDIPRGGCLNVHPSLLPKFRGPSPAMSAILADERVTGVTIMQLNERMDEGPIVAQARVELEESAWPPKGSMFEELLATEGGNLLAEVLRAWIAGDIQSEIQDNSEATYTKKFSDTDALLEKGFEARPRESLLKIRAFDKNPRAHFFIERGGKQIRVIVTDAEIRDTALIILKVTPEGKKEMDYGAFKTSFANRE